MRIISPDNLLKVDTFYYNPRCRYIVSDFEFEQMMLKAPNTQIHWSSFNSWERRYGGQDLNGKRVCVYRHAAWGDQLIASAVPRYLRTLYPDACVHLYCHPGVLPLWLGNPFVANSAIPLPIPFDVATQYDFHIFYEGMLEGNSEEDQNNCYDDFFGVIGLGDVPDSFKRPYVTVRPEDYKGMEWVRHNRPYMVYHISPDNRNRAYPPGLTKQFLLLFQKRFPQHKIVVVGIDKEQDYAECLSDLNVINLIGRTKNFRNLIPIVENSSLVICPDSSVMHLAACFPDVPVISLWGLFHPNDRIKYYPNSHPIFHEGECPHAPCRDHTFWLPKAQCKDVVPGSSMKLIKYCKVMESILPEEILAKAEKVL